MITIERWALLTVVVCSVCSSHADVLPKPETWVRGTTNELAIIKSVGASTNYNAKLVWIDDVLIIWEKSLQSNELSRVVGLLGGLKESEAVHGTMSGETIKGFLFLAEAREGEKKRPQIELQVSETGRAFVRFDRAGATDPTLRCFECPGGVIAVDKLIRSGGGQKKGAPWALPSLPSNESK